MKTWKNLIIPAGILVLLIAGLLVYNFTLKDKLNPPAQTTAGTAEADSYVVQYQPADIAEIHVLKSDGTGYAVSSSGVGADGAPVWDYASDGEDLSGYNFSQDSLSSFVNILSSCDAVKSIADAKDSLSEYGLEKPAYTVKYTLVSGEVHTLLFGSNSFDGNDVYCTLDDTGIVKTTYLIKAATCDASVMDFLDLAITTVKATDIASVTFARTEDNLDLVVSGQKVPTADGTSSEFGWEVTSPFTIEASAAFGTLMDAVLALKVTSYVDLNPDNYAKYGLDKPAYTFDITLASGNHMQIMLSKDMGGIYYGASTESPAVFSLGTSALTGLQTPLVELINPYLSYEFIANVEKIEASFPDGSFSMDMDVAKGGSITDTASAVAVNGISAKVTDDTKRSYFANLYESIVCINIKGFDFAAKPVNTKDITIAITLKDSTQKIINLAVKDENTYYAFIDGAYVGFLVSKDEIYRDNGANLYDYGAWAAYDRLMEAIDGDNGSGVYVISDS